MAIVRTHLVVAGRVQGVWFRGAMQDEARRLGLRGWVRNRRDGAVEAEVEGEEGAVEALVAWAHQGPPGARVTRVDAQRIPVAGTEREFAIRH
ncbi:MAG TPA: acylphosphatase [Candidatus Binatia bacterium]|jgi:acylphosphatase|nr:acylphosphatase [Candidatus Binatia bacterium]